MHQLVAPQTEWVISRGDGYDVVERIVAANYGGKVIHAPTTAGIRAPPGGGHTAAEREEALRILYRLRDQWTHKYIPAAAVESIFLIRA